MEEFAKLKWRVREHSMLEQERHFIKEENIDKTLAYSFTYNPKFDHLLAENKAHSATQNKKTKLKKNVTKKQPNKIKTHLKKDDTRELVVYEDKLFSDTEIDNDYLENDSVEKLDKLSARKLSVNDNENISYINVNSSETVTEEQLLDKASSTTIEIDQIIDKLI